MKRDSIRLHARGEVFAPAEPRIFVAVEVRDAGGLGDGLFAGEPLAAGQVLGIDGGVVLDSVEGVPPGPAYLVLIDEGVYLAPRDYARPDPFCRINHSCASNVARIGGLVYVAKRAVAAGEMLTVDYAPLVAGHRNWRMRCLCGEAECRGEITADDWREAAIARRLWPEWLPYIQRRILAELGPATL